MIRLQRPRTLAAALFALAAASALGACQKAQLQQVQNPGQRSDLFPQSTQAQLDAVFVVDDSRYMAVHQARVAASFGRFLSWLDENQIDYHLGLLSSDVPSSPGVYLGGTASGYFTSADATQLPAAVTALGGNGSAISAVLEQMDLALKGPPAGFLRSGATLFLVIVTDDNDPWSPGPDLYYYRTFKSAKGPGDTGIVSLSVLAGPLPDGCSVADPTNPENSFFASPAPRLIDLAGEMGGLSESLCDPDFDAVFDALGAQAAGLKRTFHLTETPDPSTLKVQVLARCDTLASALAFCASTSNDCSGTTQSILCQPPPATVQADGGSDGWSYDATSNSIVFSGSALPPRGSQIEVSYDLPDAGSLQ